MLNKNLAILFGVLLLFGCQQQVVNDELVENEVVIEELSESEDSFDSYIKVGDLEWIGHVITLEDGQKNYQLLKIDKEGNETIMYENFFDSLYPVISLKSEQGNLVDNLILDHSQGYPEGGGSTVVSFQGGDEVFRFKYYEFWGFVQQFAFKYSHSYEYQLEIETTNDCFDPTHSDVKELSEDMKTDILGLKIISEEITESFDLISPITAPCTLIDGVIAPPKLRANDILIYDSWIILNLPGGVKAYIMSDDGSKIRVEYK